MSANETWCKNTDGFVLVDHGLDTLRFPNDTMFWRLVASHIGHDNAHLNQGIFSSVCCFISRFRRLFGLKVVSSSVASGMQCCHWLGFREHSDPRLADRWMVIAAAVHQAVEQRPQPSLTTKTVCWYASPSLPVPLMPHYG